MAAPLRVRPAKAEGLEVDHAVPDAGADDVAERFHEATKYTPHNLPRTLAEYRRFPAWEEAQPLPRRPGRAFPDAAGTPLPDVRPGRALAKAFQRRRSRAPGPLADLDDVAALLASGFGVASDGGRPAPSAGALYPLEVYLVASGVRRLTAGAFHYDPYGHRLERLSDLMPDIGRWYFDEGFAVAAAHLVVTAVLPRTRVKYGARGYRFALLEAGHAVQNVLLAAEAMHVSATPVGDYYDDRVHDALGLDGVEEVVLCLVPFGRS